MVARLNEELSYSAAQQALLAQQDAERTTAAFDIGEARKLADAMQGKLYLSDEGLRAALAREAEGAEKPRAKSGERRPTATTKDVEGAADEVAAREATEVTGVKQERQPREAVTPIQSGIGVEKNEPVQIAAADGETRENGRASLMQLALGATIGGSDAGDHHAIAHLKDLMQFNPSRHELLTAIANVDKAKAAADKTRTYRTKDGQLVTATTVEDDCHTETSYTVQQEYTGGIFSGLLGSDSDSHEKGRRGGIVPTMVALGALTTVSSESGREGLSNLISGSMMDLPTMNPFSLGKLETPAQERVRGLGLLLA